MNVPAYFAACGELKKYTIELLPTWHQYLGDETNPATGQCQAKFSLMKNGAFNGGDLLLVALGIIDILIRLGALVAVGYVIYGGFRYIMSQGSPEDTKAAQSTIINAIAGLIIAILAAAIVSFIGRSIK